MKFAFLAFLAFTGLFQEPPWTPFNDPLNHRNVEPTSNIDVRHYAISLEIDDQNPNHEIKGRTTINFATTAETDTIELDASDMKIGEVTGAEAKQLQFAHKNDKLAIELGQKAPKGTEFSVTVAYTGRPTSGLYFIEPEKVYPKRPWMVWTQGETEYNHFWFPCYDHPNDKATSELFLRVREKYRTLSNGALVESKTADGWRNDHWKMDLPHAAYLTSIVVGAFDVVEDEYEGESVKVPVQYFVPKDWHTEEEIRNTFRRTPEMMRFYSEKTGVPYPYAKYAQVVVEDFIWGGMENISATTLHPGTVVKKRSWIDRDSDSLIAHELAHQWFGDLVTCRTWGHAWLNEGFATYMDACWQESVGGREALVASLESGAGQYFDECAREYTRPTACEYYTFPDDVFDAHIYPRGAWILHMLRTELGDDLWWKGIQRYLTKHRAGNVTSDDFRVAMEETSKRDLKAFFDQWVFKVGYPAFKVTAAFEPVPGRVTMTVEQTQPSRKLDWKELHTEQPVFQVPINVEIETESGRRTHRIEIKERSQTFTFDVDGIPLIIDFDRDWAVLKTLQFARTPAELMRQLERDDQPWQRWWAANELSGKAEATATLANALAHDESFRVRIAAATALGEIKSIEARRALVAALRQPATRIRVAALQALANHAEEASETLMTTFEKDASPACRAAAATSLGKRKKPVDFYGEYAKYLGDEVVFPGILAGMAEAQHPSTMNACLKATEYGVHPVIRTKATQLLGDLLKKKWDVRGRKRLLEMLDDPNFRVRGTVIEKMSVLRDSTFPDALEKRLPKETDQRMVKAIQDAIRKIRALLK